MYTYFAHLTIVDIYTYCIPLKPSLYADSALEDFATLTMSTYTVNVALDKHSLLLDSCLTTSKVSFFTPYLLLNGNYTYMLTMPIPLVIGRYAMLHIPDSFSIF